MWTVGQGSKINLQYESKNMKYMEGNCKLYTLAMLSADGQLYPPPTHHHAPGLMNRVWKEQQSLSVVITPRQCCHWLTDTQPNLQGTIGEAWGEVCREAETVPGLPYFLFVPVEMHKPHDKRLPRSGRAQVKDKGRAHLQSHDKQLLSPTSTAAVRECICKKTFFFFLASIKSCSTAVL